jgi:microcystin degradation protein MlrC
MHGAMVADGYDDCEGDLLERIRAVVGPDVPVGAELDPHCHLSARMLANATVLICYKEYPHTDFVERGEELITLCAAAARGDIKPVMSVHDCRFMGIFHTSREPMRSFVDHMKSLEGREGILSISLVHGFPWGDVADRGTKVLVVTDNRSHDGDALAERLGQEVAALRKRAMPSYLSVRQGLDQALAGDGPVVLADVSDNPGGGSPGDSTFILQALLDRGMTRAALGPLWDPVSVRLCWEAGEGARMPLRIGGKTGPMSGAPLDVTAQVLALRKDAYQSFESSRVEMGDCAAIRVEGIEIVLTTRRVQAMGRDLFSAAGVALDDKTLIVVKSSQHFYASFAPLAKRVLYVAAPGAIAPDLRQIRYEVPVRPLMRAISE